MPFLASSSRPWCTGGWNAPRRHAAKNLKLASTPTGSLVSAIAFGRSAPQPGTRQRFLDRPPSIGSTPSHHLFGYPFLTSSFVAAGLSTKTTTKLSVLGDYGEGRISEPYGSAPSAGLHHFRDCYRPLLCPMEYPCEHCEHYEQVPHLQRVLEPCCYRFHNYSSVLVLRLSRSLTSH